MYVLTRNYVKWHPRKDLEILSIHNPVCPLHGHTLIIPDGRWARTNFFLFLLLTRQSLPFRGKSRDLFNRRSWRSYPYILNPRDDGSGVCSWGNRRTLPRDADPLLPNIRQRLVLLGPHLGIHVLIEPGHHFYKKENT